MSRTDTIADAFTIIRNGAKAKKDDVLLPHSKLLLKVCEILKREGYIANVQPLDVGSIKHIKVYLKYLGKKSAIKELKKVSTTGRRVFKANKDIPIVLRGYGTAILTTSKGIFTDKEAKEQGVGGEVIGMVW